MDSHAPHPFLVARKGLTQRQGGALRPALAGRHPEVPEFDGPILETHICYVALKNTASS
jgi:hypothetical protein